ncbi:OmpA family protein [Cellulophaga sp. 20_2_10]|uniref:OmpA family protein n=1 Tax=Cellulophaga sp. 20_2_10 TaxID=2942476 RepID=UPI00201AF469|nr:OmpA family protein [Cellulophaga sp. 20_2_10]MCL5246579.1 OmpA family protein [Cellulophaga sp. 20_2_10]
MTKKLMYLLGIIITILVGTYFYYTCCSSCGTTATDTPVNKNQEQVKTPIVQEATSYPFSLEGNGFSYDTNDNFNFNTSGFAILDPLSKKVDNGVEAIKKHIEQDSKNAVTITGYYKDSETNNSAFPNLGIARANTIKNYMVTKGIPSSNLNIAGQLKEDMVAKDSVYLGPVAYTVGVNEDNSEQMSTLYQKIKDNPLVLHFKTGEAAISLTVEQRQKIADISTYLDKVDGSLCTVIGHTDNVGDRNNNISLGLSRAEFAKQYLVNNGISATKVSASSKGPDVPIESNDTEEGKAKNRRTVVTLK